MWQGPGKQWQLVALQSAWVLLVMGRPVIGER